MTPDPDDEATDAEYARAIGLAHKLVSQYGDSPYGKFWQDRAARLIANREAFRQSRGMFPVKVEEQ